MKQIKLYIVISTIVHMISLSPFLAWLHFARNTDMAGFGKSKESVSIWVDSINDASLATSKIWALAQKQKVPSTMQHSQNKEIVSESDPESLKGTSSVTGQETGAGFGPGNSGDPRLTQIWKKINRSKYYPEAARRGGLQGSPRVVFSINENGSVTNVNLIDSCGEALLDAAALETIRRAAPLPYYPVPVKLAVRYELK